MSLPFLPLFVAEFDSDTNHLSIEEDGIYNRLLRLCWQTPGCSIPNDDQWIARKMRVTAEFQAQKVRPILVEFFITTDENRLLQKRLKAEYDNAVTTQRKRALAGSLGGRAKRTIENIDKNIKPGLSDAEAGLKQPEPEPNPVEKREAIASPKKKIGTRLSHDWYLPKDWGEWALTEGMTVDEIRYEAGQFKDWWTAAPKGVKLDWPATWRVWIRKALKARGSKNGHAKPTRADEWAEALGEAIGFGAEGDYH